MPVQAIPTTPKRLRILGAEEIDALYGRPRFTPDERQEYFAFSPPELAALEQFRSHPSRLYAMLQLGYFKARQQFFVFSLPEAAEDIRYLQERYFAPDRCQAVEVSKVTRLKQQHVILGPCHYRYCDAAARQHLAAKAQQAATVGPCEEGIGKERAGSHERGGEHRKKWTCHTPLSLGAGAAPMVSTEPSLAVRRCLRSACQHNSGAWPPLAVCHQALRRGPAACRWHPGRAHRWRGVPRARPGKACARGCSAG
jgi:Domain of unknown function (DUF4158)